MERLEKQARAIIEGSYSAKPHCMLPSERTVARGGGSGSGVSSGAGGAARTAARRAQNKARVAAAQQVMMVTPHPAVGCLGPAPRHPPLCHQHKNGTSLPRERRLSLPFLASSSPSPLMGGALLDSSTHAGETPSSIIDPWRREASGGRSASPMPAPPTSAVYAASGTAEHCRVMLSPSVQGFRNHATIVTAPSEHSETAGRTAASMLAVGLASSHSDLEFYDDAASSVNRSPAGLCGTGPSPPGHHGFLPRPSPPLASPLPSEDGIHRGRRRRASTSESMGLRWMQPSVPSPLHQPQQQQQAVMIPTLPHTLPPLSPVIRTLRPTASSPHHATGSGSGSSPHLPGSKSPTPPPLSSPTGFMGQRRPPRTMALTKQQTLSPPLLPGVLTADPSGGHQWRHDMAGQGDNNVPRNDSASCPLPRLSAGPTIDPGLPSSSMTVHHEYVGSTSAHDLQLNARSRGYDLSLSGSGLPQSENFDQKSMAISATGAASPLTSPSSRRSNSLSLKIGGSFKHL